MTIRPMIRIHDIEKNEITDREMDNFEFAQYQTDMSNKEIDEAQVQAKATAKAALLEKLGITADEANLLLG